MSIRLFSECPFTQMDGGNSMDHLEFFHLANHCKPPPLNPASQEKEESSLSSAILFYNPWNERTKIQCFDVGSGLGLHFLLGLINFLRDI